jgi:hypothetical protein
MTVFIVLIEVVSSSNRNVFIVFIEALSSELLDNRARLEHGFCQKFWHQIRSIN